KRIVEQIEQHLNITLDVEYHRGIGRPHIARAVINHPDTSLSYDEVFDELIGEGKPCYVARNIPSFSKGHSILTEACSVVGLAHPFRYDDPESALEVTTELDAVERYYPYDQPDSAIRNDNEPT
ncbi:MAG: PHP domain-containing protein, partial [Halobacteriaceae archaeon]